MGIIVQLTECSDDEKLARLSSEAEGLEKSDMGAVNKASTVLSYMSD